MACSGPSPREEASSCGYRRPPTPPSTSPPTAGTRCSSATAERSSTGKPSRSCAGFPAPDGRIVTAYVDGTRLFARLVDPRSGRVRDLQPGETSYGCAAATPSFTPDSRLMAIVDGCINVVVWDLRSGLMRVDLATGRFVERPGTQTVAKALAISPDGRFYDRPSGRNGP